MLAPVVGTWCEVSDDFDLLIELIAHALADKETSMLRVAHDQAVARQRQKLTAVSPCTSHGRGTALSTYVKHKRAYSSGFTNARRSSIDGCYNSIFTRV